MTSTYFFDVYGSYEVSRTGRSCDSNQSRLWENLECTYEGISTAIGCYMFVLMYGRRITPWYVGMTVAQAGFKQEVFTPHKIRKYNYVMDEYNGKPRIFLFPLCNSEGERYSSARLSGRGPIKKLERMLMGFAYARNPELGNVKEMHFLRNTTVRGVFGEKSRGRPHTDVTEARLALFGNKADPDQISN